MAEGTAPGPAADADGWRQALAALASLAGAGRLTEARQLLQELQTCATEAGERQPLIAREIQAQLRQWHLRLAPWWWEPIGRGAVVLRRTRSEDADFWRSAYGETDFARRFNRQQPWRGDLARALQKSGDVIPLDQGAIHWVICAPDGERLGIASLTNLNPVNARAEFAIGFPRPAGAMQATLASLWVFHFAFFLLRWNKLTTYVYSDNAVARHNSLRLGLREEGLLKEHFLLPPGEFVDVFAFGLTRRQLLDDRRLVAMAKRRLGQDWAAGS